MSSINTGGTSGATRRITSEFFSGLFWSLCSIYRNEKCILMPTRNYPTETMRSILPLLPQPCVKQKRFEEIKPLYLTFRQLIIVAARSMFTGKMRLSCLLYSFQKIGKMTVIVLDPDSVIKSLLKWQWRCGIILLINSYNKISKEI